MLSRLPSQKSLMEYNTFLFALELLIGRQYAQLTQFEKGNNSWTGPDDSWKTFRPGNGHGKTPYSSIEESKKNIRKSS
ncbi:hypothetical protein TNIN_462541 [Trichonephila inaurata madagascariensis]|uniref:Uncharacterized protein n=1 Tax=Trichonephila inaurata madagascariensis TaxID=2747483 RepID=A0A8X6YBC0_9ARAC|nr:hypothetical protein TNIN_462541 [Trichonephila inaurata madagascariensis]